jgi:hypothetical protein
MKTKINGKKGQGSGLLFLVGIVVAVIVVIMLLPYISSALGIFNPSSQNLPITQGIAVSSIQYPSSVSPSTTFDVNFLIVNNINGHSANNINFCLDNVGIFTIQSSPNDNGKPQQCTSISNLFAGGSVPETFALEVPSNHDYENIPYAQLLGYFVNYSYSATASQSLEFSSQSAYNSNSYPAPTFGSFGNTAGPVSITTSATQPVIYGAAAQMQLLLVNVGNGIIIGPVNVNVTMNPSLIDMGIGSYGFSPFVYPNSTVSSNIYTGQIDVGASGTTVTLPISLASSEQSQLTSNGVPYLSTNVQVSIAYEYEQDGFFQIDFNVQNFYIK